MKLHLAQLGPRTSAPGVGAILAACLGLGLPSALASPGHWVRTADLPAIRIAAAGTSVDGILYVAGGVTAAPYGAPTRTLFAYDPSVGAWTQKVDMPTARALGAAAEAEGLLYIIGGVVDVTTRTVVSSVEAYDPKTDTWTKKASMPTARGDVAACTLDGRIYVVGGWVPGAFLSVVECYDPKTDLWTRKADLPVTAEVPVVQAVDHRMYAFTGGRTFVYDAEANRWSPRADLPADSLKAVASAVGVIDGRVYLFGGLARPSDCASASALVYDPVLDQFTALPLIPTPTALAVSGVIGGKVYIAGGSSGVGSAECAGGGVGYRCVRVFDPNGIDVAPGTWTRKASLPAVRLAAASGVVDGIMYVATGNSAPGAMPQPRTLFAYDPKTDVWSRKADIPTGRDLAAAAVADGLFYVIGGIEALDPVTVVDTVEAYNPKTDTWTTKAPMPTARGDVAGCTLDGKIYVVGGAVPGVFLSVVECYDPKTDTWTTKASLPVTAEVPVAQVANGRMLVFVEERTFLYDAANDRWTEGRSLPPDSLQVRATAAGVIDDQVYLLGGFFRPSTCGSANVLVYDPVQDQFTWRPTMPAPNCGAAAGVIDGKLYLAGGASGIQQFCSGSVTYQDLWAYDPKGRAAPHILSCSFQGGTSWRLAWEAEPGEEYGVEATTRLGDQPWETLALSTGLTIVATNTVVEMSEPIATGKTARFFRVKRID